MRKIIIIALIISLMLFVGISNFNIKEGKAFENNNQHNEIKGKQKQIQEGVSFRILLDDDNRLLLNRTKVNLTLNGEPFYFPEEVLEMWQHRRYSTMVYPLIVIPSKEDRVIYHLKEEQILFTNSDIITQLEKNWDEITGGEPFIRVGEEVKPVQFSDYTMAKLSPSGQKIFMSVQYYVIATKSTIVSVKNKENGKINM